MPSKDTGGHVEDLPIAEMKKRVDRALELIGELKALFPGLVTMTEDDRRHSQGRMRAGEPDALRKVIDVVEHQPAVFQSLGDVDEGHDPNKFETQLLRDRLDKRDLLQQVATALDPVATGVGDTVLHLGGLVRPATLAAYRLAKALAQTDQKVRSLLAGAIDFFSHAARAGAETRAARKASPAS